MSKISSRAVPVAAVAALVLSGMGAGLPIDSARADNNCIVAPNASVPQGQHWYYHVDRQTHRKCWYLHATVRLLHHAVVQPAAVTAKSVSAERTPPPAVDAPAPMPAAATAKSAGAEQAPQPAVEVPTAASSADTTQAEPHVTVLTVKTINTPFVGGPNEVQQRAPDNTNMPPVSQTPAPQESAAVNGANPTSRAGQAPAEPAADSRQTPVPTIDAPMRTTNAANAAFGKGPAEQAPAEPAATRQTPVPMIDAPVRTTDAANAAVGTGPAEQAPAEPAADSRQMPVPTIHAPVRATDAANAAAGSRVADMFLLLAFALGTAAILIAVASKIADLYRAPRLSNHPDDVWMRYRAASQISDEEIPHAQSDVPLLAPQAEPGLSDLQQQQWTDQSLPAHAGFPAQSENGDLAPAQQSRPSPKNIELALRVLRQARQSRVA